MRFFVTCLLLLAVASAGPVSGHPSKPRNILEALMEFKHEEHSVDVLLEAAMASDPGLQKTATSSKLVATVLAPTDVAFSHFLKELGLTKKQFLANKKLLNLLLNYHMIPGVALKTNHLKATQTAQTAVPGHAGKVNIRKGPNGSVAIVTTSTPKKTISKVVHRNIEAGKTVIHIVDHVLIPKM